MHFPKPKQIFDGQFAIISFVVSIQKPTEMNDNGKEMNRMNDSK